MPLSRARIIEEERHRTLREWNTRIERLNSIDEGLVEPRVTSLYATGGRGYAGFYHYLTAKDSCRRGTGTPKRPTNFERWISEKNGKPSQRKGQDAEEPLQINQSELNDVHRCFQA